MKSAFNTLVALLALLLVPAAAHAQAYPTRAIRFLVPFPPGGPADIVGRIIGQKMSDGLGRQVMIENRPGANTIIAAELAAKAAPDGYTVFMAMDATLALNPFLYSKLPYDPIRDFEPVSMIAVVSGILVANSNFPANSVQEVVAMAKAKPAQVMFGTGTLAMQLAGELFNSMAGTKLVNVPYKGAAPAITALMAGEVPMLFSGISMALLSNWKAGKVKVIAAVGPKRLPQAPDVPTIAEQGVPGYAAQVWQSMVVPAGTPREIVLKLNTELTRVLSLPEVRERLSVNGIEPMPSTPEELAAYIRSESTKWGKLIREIGLKLE